MLSRWLKKPCPHEAKLVIRSSHVQRTVCEDCGQVSFTMEIEPRFDEHSSAYHQSQQTANETARQVAQR